MKTKLKSMAAALLLTLMWINDALAKSDHGGGGHGGGGHGGGWGDWGGHWGGGHGSGAVPEFDGPGGIAAIALLVSIGVVLYNKIRK